MDQETIAEIGRKITIPLTALAPIISVAMLTYGATGLISDMVMKGKGFKDFLYTELGGLMVFAAGVASYVGYRLAGGDPNELAQLHNKIHLDSLVSGTALVCGMLGALKFAIEPVFEMFADAMAETVDHTRETD